MAINHKSVQDLLLAANTLACTSDSPYLDSQILLANCLDQSKEWLLAHGDEEVSDCHRDQFLELMKRRKNGEPVAYLLGYRDFWNSRLKVTRDTLIPRPDTELLVETILNNFDNQERLVVDLGTGSGAIAISLAIERPQWTIIGVDLSYRALCVAKENGADLQNLHWLQSDWGNAFCSHSIDLLICNPPYISEDDTHLDALSYEPREALVSANNGLQDLEEVIASAQSILTTDGHLLIEHGHEQQTEVCERLEKAKFDSTPLNGLNGTPRAVWSRRALDS